LRRNRGEFGISPGQTPEKPGINPGKARDKLGKE